ncbi:MAG: signal peptidase II [Thermodesulfobacteriota bacterium]
MHKDFVAALKPVLSTAATILLLDQVVKFYVQANFTALDKEIVVPGFFNLVYVLNKGAAFGILNREDIYWQTYFFLGISLVAILVILYLLYSIEDRDKYLLFGMGAILGGALGNLVDRVRLGMVIDYLDFYFKSFHWPAFNIADTAITLGAISVLISLIKKENNASNTD